MSLVSSRIALWNSKSSEGSQPSKPSNADAQTGAIANLKWLFRSGKAKENTPTPQPVVLAAPVAPAAPLTLPQQMQIEPGLVKQKSAQAKSEPSIAAQFPLKSNSARSVPSAFKKQVPRLSTQELQSTVCVIGAPKSGVSTVGALVKARIDGKALPFSALLDSTDVFYTEEDTYFGRMGKRVMTIDHRATMMSHLAAIIFVVDANDLSTAFQVPWKPAGGAPYLGPKISKPAPMMNENNPWLPQMVAGHLDALIGKPVLILCNKSDMPNAKTAEQVRERLLSAELQGMIIRVQECIAQSGIGVHEGMEWIHQQLQHKQIQGLRDSFQKAKASKSAASDSSATSSDWDSSGVWIGKLSNCLGFCKSSVPSTSGNSSPGPEVEKAGAIMEKPAASSFGFHTLLSAAKVIV